MHARQPKTKNAVPTKTTSRPYDECLDAGRVPCDDAPDCCAAPLSARESEACLRDTLSACLSITEDIGVLLFGYEPCQPGDEPRPAPHGLAPLLSERVDACRVLHDRLCEIKGRLA